VIDEAVELAKRFCSDEAGALVNGVLGSLAISEKERVSSIRREDNRAGGVAV
jgi:transcription termination factor NusB